MNYKLNKMAKTGKLHLYLGCMRSGKTTSLINDLQRYESIGKKFICISSIKDKRSGVNEVKTHDGVVFNAYKTMHLTKRYKNEEGKEFSLPSIPHDVSVIGIDECQFFSDLVPFVNEKLKKGYIIILAGLDGDYKQNEFGDILKFIPKADSYKKLYAFCSMCKDGTQASFTKRINTECKKQELVGANDYYISVCRKHL